MEAYGKQFLSVIKSHCTENNVELDQGNKLELPRKESSQVSRRREYIWKRYQAGEAVKSIAASLGFTQSTILKHLGAIHSCGYPIRVEGLQDLSTLSQDEESKVLKSFDELGTFRLKPVYEKFDGTIPYEQLHIWRLIFKVMYPEKDANQDDQSVPSES